MRNVATRIACYFWFAICVLVAGTCIGASRPSAPGFPERPGAVDVPLDESSAESSLAGPAADLSRLLPHVSEAELASIDAWWRAEPQAIVPVALARLAYQVRRLPQEVVEEENARRVDPSTAPLESVTVAGRVQRVRQLSVPAELVEFLEFESVWLAEIRDAEAEEVSVLLTAMPATWTPSTAVGQPVEIGGVYLAGANAAGPLVVGRFLRWFPDRARQGVPGAWVTLAEHGVDIAALSELAKRGGQPLVEEDRDSFYQLLSAAPELGDAMAGDRAETPVARLLSDAEALVGHAVWLPLSTRRVTRVEITDPDLRRQVGAEAYWQIDAFGDLEGTDVHLDLPGQEGASVAFGPRFPVTVVARELPPELERAMEREAGGPAAQALVDRPIVVWGVFFRLVSYETDYVRRRGGEAQVGPLVVAVRVADAGGGGVPEAALQRFSWLVAGVFFLGLGSAIGWIVWTGRRDSRIEQARRKSAPDRLPAFEDSFPDGSAGGRRSASGPRDVPPT